MISHNEIEELEKHTLCVDCIGEQFLKAMIDDHGKIGVCYYCGKRQKVTTICELANEIHAAFEHHYQRTDTDPSDLEYSLSKEIGYDWEREGNRLSMRLPRLLGSMKLRRKIFARCSNTIMGTEIWKKWA